ncbi:MAG: NAD(P)-dependent oxidoreductase [Acidimicrobiia bacterium]
MAAPPGPKVALAPAGARDWLEAAVRQGGGQVVPVEEAEVLIWTATAEADALGAVLAGAGRGIRWVQLPWAGIEPYVGVLDEARTWTCGKGVYAEPVAEHALALLLAGLRGLDRYVGASSWAKPRGANLLGTKVVILGGGGIAESLLRLLGPFGCDVTVVRRRRAPMEGAARVVGADDVDAALDGALGVVVALALTPETEGVINRARLERMHPDGWLVNVARGRHVVTDDLVGALGDGVIGGAGLDVTEPEPLPEGHRLWTLPNCIITPHVGNTPEMAVPLLSGRIAENLRRWSAGLPLLGLVEPGLGY